MSVTAEYVGKRRADVPVDAVTQTPEPSLPSDLGEFLAAQELAEAAPAQPYVGKRRAAVEVDSIAPAAVVTAPQATDTAPVPCPEALAPAPAIESFIDDASPLELSSATLYELSDSMRKLLSEETRTDIPRITLDLATDLSAEDTAEVPAIGGRRSRGNRARAKKRVSFASAPACLGAAALAVAIGGTVHLSQAEIASLASTRLVAATALSGTSADSVSDRATVSRDSDRAVLADNAEAEAQARVEALGQIDQQATAQSEWLADNQWISPLTSFIITGWFGESGHSGPHHNGLDLAVPTGTPIYAIDSGTILEAGLQNSGYEGYGIMALQHLADGTELLYAHMSQVAVSVGQTITKGQIIGYAGSTGFSTGSHLHLEVHPGGGDPVDPVPALEARGVEVDPEHRDPRIP